MASSLGEVALPNQPWPPLVCTVVACLAALACWAVIMVLGWALYLALR